MARGRFLSESVAKDKRLNDLPIEAALVYLMAIPHLDRDGIIDGDAPVLWGTVCPRRRELLDSMDDVIETWIESGLVMRYETDEGAALWFVGFGKNQQGLRYDREAPSRFPEPPGYARTPSGLVPRKEQTRKGQAPDQVRTNSGLSPAQVEGEVQVEVEVEGVAAAATAELSDVIDAWTLNKMGGDPVGAIFYGLEELTHEHGAQNMLKSIAIACERDKRTLGYVRGILNKGIDMPRNGNGATYTDATLIPDEDDEDE